MVQGVFGQHSEGQGDCWGVCVGPGLGLDDPWGLLQPRVL